MIDVSCQEIYKNMRSLLAQKLKGKISGVPAYQWHSVKYWSVKLLFKLLICNFKIDYSTSFGTYLLSHGFKIYDALLNRMPLSGLQGHIELHERHRSAKKNNGGLRFLMRIRAHISTEDSKIRK